MTSWDTASTAATSPSAPTARFWYVAVLVVVLGALTLGGAESARADHGSVPDSTCEAMASVSAVEAPICFELRHAIADMRSALLSEQENATAELTTANVTLAAILVELQEANEGGGETGGVVSLDSGTTNTLQWIAVLLAGILGGGFMVYALSFFRGPLMRGQPA